MDKRKNLLNEEIELRKNYVKRNLLECIEAAKKEFDLTYKNFKEHEIIPYDFREHCGLKAMEGFMLWYNQLYALEEIQRQYEIKRKRKIHDRNKSKNS